MAAMKRIAFDKKLRREYERRASQLDRDINNNYSLQSYIRVGTEALKDYNPKDNRTHPMVRQIIAQRGARAGFFVRDGILFQLTTGLFETKGVAAYWPVRGGSMADMERLEKIFGPEWQKAVFWTR